MKKISIVLLLIFIFSGLAMAQEEELTPYEIGLQRIEEARANTAIYLDLSGLGLRELPPEIGTLSNLLFLHVQANYLSDLPSEIGNLGQLCFLNLSNNQFQHLPHVLVQLSHLDIINETCWQYPVHGLYFDNNPLISPSKEVIAQGTPAILEYLRNEVWWHFQRLLLGGLSFAGILAGTVLGLRWKNRRGKTKRKNEEFSE